MEIPNSKLADYALQQLIAPGGTSAVFAGLRKNEALQTPWQVAVKLVWQTKLARAEAENLINLGNIKGVVNLIDYFEVSYAQVTAALAPLAANLTDFEPLQAEDPARQASDLVGVLILQFLAGEPLVTRTEAVAADWRPKDPKRVLVVQDIETGFWLRQDLARNFDLQTRLKILQAIARYVAECHARGIVHGDLKPQNILFNPENEQVTILDFGGSTALTRGTPGWQAPEHLKLAQGKIATAPKELDIFLLGLFLNRFLEPFLVPGVKPLTERCLGPAAQRPTAAELENSLTQLERKMKRSLLKVLGLTAVSVGLILMLLWWFLS